MNKIVECVPNFSEGRNLKVFENIVDAFRGKKGLKLLDYSSDEDHNRSVVTVIGEPMAMKAAIIEAVGLAIQYIDMTKHKGQHPRMGCVDVIPFIPIKNMTIEEADQLAKEVAKEASEKYNYPFFLYEFSATEAHRRNLSDLRKGEFENMDKKVKRQEFIPDFGPKSIHPTGGITAIGARMPLIAYNIRLDTDNIQIADKIAKQVRNINGGFRYCKAIGISLKKRGIVEVSMNLTNYNKTAMYRVFETVKMECRRYGVQVLGSEIIGMVPMEALAESAAYYLGLENFTMNQIIESRLLNE